MDWTGVRVAAIEYEEVGEAIMVVVEWVGVVALAGACLGDWLSGEAA